MKANNYQSRLELRKKILQQRQKLEASSAKAAWLAIAQRLKTHPAFCNIMSVASFVGIRGEIDTAAINNQLLDDGHRLSLPVVHPEKAGIMDFYAISNLKDLKEGRYKIPEPPCEPAKRVLPDAIDIMLVPLVAFDAQGNRLGMGGGYYDRMLKKVSAECLTIGLAYDFQEVPEVYSEAWDMPLDEIITPTRHLIFTV